MSAYLQALKKAHNLDGEGLIRQFLADYSRNTVTGREEPPQMRGQVIVHKQPDLGEIWVSESMLKDWCKRRDLSYKSLVDDLSNKGIVRIKTRRFLGEYTKYESGYNVVIIFWLEKLI